jgi:cyclophilin family peptidyl-prolyl cis-trans isomerase
MSRKWLRQCPLLVALVCTVGLGTGVFGQDDPPDAVQPPANPPKTETPDAAETPATGDQTDASQDGSASPVTTNKSAFSAKLDEWKTIIKSMRALSPRYALSTEDEAIGIQQEWADLIKRGELLIPELRATGKAAYAAAQGQDRAVEQFLKKLLIDDIEHDRYERGLDLGNSLLASGCDAKEVIEATGVAAFCTNDFDGAETLFKRAQEAGGLSDKGLHNLSLIESYKTHWATEKELREKEAAADDLPRVKVVTNRGELIVELLENEAPDTVGNFISLVEKEFYDGLAFHRVLPGFMAQGGCPQGTGSGGPGYTIMCETDAENHRKHFRGTLSMAHAGKHSGGSQFFLTFLPTPHLDGEHTVFGRVIEGLDVLGELQRIDPTGEDRTSKPDVIVTMRVIRKRDHAYKPNKSQ